MSERPFIRASITSPTATRSNRICPLTPPARARVTPPLGKQLGPPRLKTRGVRLTASPISRGAAPLARLGPAGRAAAMPTAARRAEHSQRLAAVTGRLEAHPTPGAAGWARFLKPQPSVAHPGAAGRSAGGALPSLGSPRSTSFAARLPASYAQRATDAR